MSLLTGISRPFSNAMMNGRNGSRCASSLIWSMVIRFFLARFAYGVKRRAELILLSAPRGSWRACCPATRAGQCGGLDGALVLTDAV